MKSEKINRLFFFAKIRTRIVSVFLISSANVLQGCDKVIQYLRRNHDAIPVGAYLLCNAYHTTSGIAFEVNVKSLAIRYDFLRANDIVVHFSIPGLFI